MSRRRLCSLALSFTALCGSSGCSSWTLFVKLRAEDDINQGRALQVLLRSVSVETYRSEPYAVLARLITQPDKSVRRILTIEPRSTRRFFLSVPAKEPLALYFLYGSQTGSWKMLLPPPLPWSVNIPLGRSGVLVEAVRECRLGR